MQLVNKTFPRTQYVLPLPSPLGSQKFHLLLSAGHPFQRAILSIEPPFFLLIFLPWGWPAKGSPQTFPSFRASPKQRKRMEFSQKIQTRRVSRIENSETLSRGCEYTALVSGIYLRNSRYLRTAKAHFSVFALRKGKREGNIIKKH